MLHIPIQWLGLFDAVSVAELGELALRTGQPPDIADLIRDYGTADEAAAGAKNASRDFGAIIDTVLDHATTTPAGPMTTCRRRPTAAPTTPATSSNHPDPPHHTPHSTPAVLYSRRHPSRYAPV